MLIPTFAPPIGPSPGTSHKRTVNLWETEFGDGYSQVQPKGLNHIRKTVTLQWAALTFDQMTAIVGFFDGQLGYRPFLFAPFGETAPIRWTCKDWSSSTEGGIWSVVAELVQDFTNHV